MLPHLYVHYDDGAVSHLFQVAAGLDSMAVGEGQILGQTREALRLGPGARHRRAGPQRALPAGPAGRQALPRRDRHRQRRPLAGQRRPRPLGRGDRRPRRQAGPRGRRRRDGRPGHRHRLPPRAPAEITVANRSAERAARLAGEYGGRPVPLSQLSAELARRRRGDRVRRGDGPARHRRHGRGRAAPTTGRWRSSTSRCRTTSTPRSAACPASPWSTSPSSRRSCTSPRPGARCSRSGGS